VPLDSWAPYPTGYQTLSGNSYTVPPVTVVVAPELASTAVAAAFLTSSSLQASARPYFPIQFNSFRTASASGFDCLGESPMSRGSLEVSKCPVPVPQDVCVGSKTARPTSREMVGMTACYPPPKSPITAADGFPDFAWIPGRLGRAEGGLLDGDGSALWLAGLTNNGALNDRHGSSTPNTGCGVSMAHLTWDSRSVFRSNC